MLEELTDSPAIPRLIALMDAGYQIDRKTSSTAGNVVWLDHPAARRFSEPNLLVFSDGLVVGRDSIGESRKQLRIGPKNKDEFDRFQRSVPAPTWWEKNHGPFHIALGWAVFIGLSVLGGLLIDSAWRFIR